VATVLMSQSNRASIVLFSFVFLLIISQDCSLFSCYINETHNLVRFVRLKKEGNGKGVQPRPISKEAREILYKFTKVDREGNFYFLRFVRLTTTLDPMH
jgi:hypothetical protein